MNEPTRFRVLADLEISDRFPFKANPGDVALLERADTSWPGWIWVQCKDHSGWVPAQCLEDPLKSQTHFVLPFDGTELSARRGEILEALEICSGWILARNQNGETGWFPQFNLRPEN